MVREQFITLCDELIPKSYNEGTTMKQYAKGLDGRQRDSNGQIREKRGDTRVGTLRKEYGSHFAEGYRSDTKLETIRENESKSLSELLRKKQD